MGRVMIRFRNQITGTVQYTQTYLQEAVKSKTASRPSWLKGGADSEIKQCNQFFSAPFIVVVVVVVVVYVGSTVERIYMELNCFGPRNSGTQDAPFSRL